ncbi:MAG TPA: DUF4430 domain-containing protein [Candidatus Pristimantibacillus sp.]|nr:DUF4430 domain-containing protein [Candidatus Pristimantibacillus sp.]
MGEKQESKKLIVAIVAILVLMTGATSYVLKSRLGGNDSAAPVATVQTSPRVAGDQTAKDTYLTYNGVDGKNALDLLKANATVVTKDSSYGPYVDTINGVKGGTDGKYWAFYVNGNLAQVGAADYQTKTGDKIEWKFE